VYKVCDCCGELFLESEEHEYFEDFGFVCFLCLEEGFKLPSSKEEFEESIFEKEGLESFNDGAVAMKFPQINLNS